MYTSQNPRPHHLYSGTIGSYLPSSQHAFDRDHNKEQLERAAAWLKGHNPVVRAYIEDVINESRRGFPTMACTDRSELRPSDRPDILVSGDAYDAETRNEDFRHGRLIEGEDLRSPKAFIGKGHPDLEAMMFPVLYPQGRGHHQQDPDDRKQETIFRNAQRKIDMAVPHF